MGDVYIRGLLKYGFGLGDATKLSYGGGKVWLEEQK